MRVDRVERRGKRTQSTKKPGNARCKPVVFRQVSFTSEAWYERAALLISIPLDRREQRNRH